MTKAEYEEVYTPLMNAQTLSEGTFRWELIKVLWEIRDALKGGLEE